MKIKIKLNRIKSSRGFTLLEVMAAMAFISIALVSIYRMQSQTILMNIDSKFYTIAPMLAQQVFSEAELNSFSSLTNSGDFGENFKGYTWKIKTEEIESEQSDDISENITKININISIDDSISYNLETYKFLSK